MRPRHVDEILEKRWLAIFLWQMKKGKQNAE